MSNRNSAEIQESHLLERINTVDSMRKSTDKKGGGLLMMYKESCMNLKKMTNNNTDLLHVTMQRGSIKLHIILVYFSVVTKPEDKEFNKKMKSEIEKMIEARNENEEPLIVMGDFNGHIGLIGMQKENDNGKMVLEWMNDHNMALLNLDDKCKGQYTWQRGEQRSAIDFVMVNGKGYQWVMEMEIDEDKDVFDLSDHNLITLKLQLPANRSKDLKKGEKITVEYYKTEEVALNVFSEEVGKRIQENSINGIKSLNSMMKDVANEKLKARYTRKMAISGKEVKEPPWINEEIRMEIKKRKSLNREKRKAASQTEADDLHAKYVKQKRYVQKLIKEQISRHEKKVTEEIRLSSNKSKSLWENIDKLRQKERRTNDHVCLYDSNGGKLENEEAAGALAEFWKGVYQKHENTSAEVWNDERKQSYENETKQNKEAIKVRKLLQEHTDMDQARMEEIVPMDEPEINEGKVHRCVQRMRNKTAAGPDGLKTEFYKAITKTGIGLKTLTDGLKKTLKEAGDVTDWKDSKQR